MKRNLKNLISRHLPEFTLLIYVIAVTVGAIQGGIWAGLGIGLAVILFAFTWGLDKKIPLPPNDLAGMAMGFFLITAALNLQSSQPDLSWHEWLRMASIFVPLLFLLSPSVEMRAGHAKFFTVLPAALVLGGLVLAVQLHLKAIAAPSPEAIPFALVKYNRGFSYLVVLSFPIMAVLWFSKKRWLIIPFLLLLLIPASMTESRSSKLALVLAVPVIVVAQIAPALVRHLLMAGAVVAVGWPFAAREFFVNHYDWVTRIPDSWRARVEIWDYMSYRILEQPFLGWGLGTSHALPFQEPHGALYTFTVRPAAHPHNVMTQLWVELGIPGLVLGLVFAFLTLRKCSQLDRRLAPFAFGAWTACFCLSLIAYDFWTDSLFAAFAMAGLAFAMLQRQFTSSQVWKAAPATRR